MFDKEVSPLIQYLATCILRALRIRSYERPYYGPKTFPGSTITGYKARLSSQQLDMQPRLLELVRFLATENSFQLVEIEDLVIHQAMLFENVDQELGIKVRSVVSSINRDDLSWVTAHFMYKACTGKEQTFQPVASDHICISIRERSPQKLPATGHYEPNMVDVPPEILNSALKDVGYGYTGPFKVLSELKRTLGNAFGFVVMTAAETNGEALTIHPAVLYAAFYSIVLAFSYPKDGQLWALHLPTRV